MISDKEKENRAELFKLMQENPDLPVVPMVECDVVADDGGRWEGSRGESFIDEYFYSEKAEEFIFKSDRDIFDVLEECMSDEEYGELPETKEECRPYYDALPWKKAIIVCINLPE